MRYYAIADLHGRYDLLELALGKIADHADTAEHTIITLGDYVDRGPKSRSIIEELMERQSDMFISLQGNHEDMMVQTIVTPLAPNWWVGNGGGKTLLSYGHPKELIGPYCDTVNLGVVPQEHIKWLGSLPLYYETPKQVFVHAGIPNDAALERQDKEKMLWMLYSKDDPGGWRGKHVVHGHHQFADGPHVWAGRTDLDSFAWHEGRLVVGVFDDTQGPAIEFIEVKDA